MTLLTAKNQYIETAINIRELAADVVSRSFFESVMSHGTHLYLTNQLILTLGDGPYIFTPDDVSSIKTYWNNYIDLWNLLGSSWIIQRDKRLVLSFTSFGVDAIRRRVGTDFGIMYLPLKFKNTDTDETIDKLYSFKITHNEVFSVVPEASVDIPVIENSYTTPFYSFESLFIPTLSGKFVYNYFENNETDFERMKRRNYSSTPLIKIPKYIELNWTKAPKYIPPLSAVGEVDASFPEVRSEEEGTTFLDGFMFEFDGASFSGIILGGTTRTSEDSDRTFGGASIDDALAERVADDLRSGTSDFLSTTEVEPSTLIPDIVATDYAGYVIQKERFNEEIETFEPIDLFVFHDRNITSWIDWRIAYGEVYRYKIRSIFRFVNSKGLSMYRDSDQLLDFSDQSSLFERGTRLAETYYYDSKFSKPANIEAIETQKPEPPHNVKIFPNSYKNYIFLTWNQKDSNKDVLGFNVYRKLANEFFIKLNSDLISTRDNYFIDYSVELNQEYIYAIESIDVHDNFSNLSGQYKAKIISQNYETDRCEAPIFLHEKEGGQILSTTEKTIINTNIELFNNSFKIQVNPVLPNIDRTEPLIFKIMSLDTGIKKELKINFKVKTIYHRDLADLSDAREQAYEVNFDRDLSVGISSPVESGPGGKIISPLDPRRGRR